MSTLLRNKTLGRRFGRTEEGFVDLPAQVSNIKISRIFAEHRGECGRCFPHGFEANNATANKNLRSWKNYRQRQSHTS